MLSGNPRNTEKPLWLDLVGEWRVEWDKLKEVEKGQSTESFVNQELWFHSKCNAMPLERSVFKKFSLAAMWRMDDSCRGSGRPFQGACICPGGKWGRLGLWQRRWRTVVRSLKWGQKQQSFVLELGTENWGWKRGDRPFYGDGKD